MSRVCRQFTAEEKEMVLTDPATCHPADIVTKVLPKMADTAAHLEQGEQKVRGASGIF